MIKICVISQFFFLVTFAYSFGQYYVLRSNNSEGIPYVFIQTSRGNKTFSDEQGQFNINVFPGDTLFFQCLGYKPLMVWGDEITNKKIFFMEPLDVALEEVLVTEPKKIGKHSWFGVRGSLKNRYSFLSGMSLYQFVRNESGVRGEVTHLKIRMEGILRVENGKKKLIYSQSLERISERQPCFLLINFLDGIEKFPGRELLSQDISVHLSLIKRGKIIVPLKDYNITFLKDGLWVRMKLDCFCDAPNVKNMIIYKGLKNENLAYFFKKDNSLKLYKSLSGGALGVQLKVSY